MSEIFLGPITDKAVSNLDYERTHVASTASQCIIIISTYKSINSSEQILSKYGVSITI